MLKDPPLLTIKRHFDRLSEATLKRLDGAQTGHLVDAMHGRGAMEKAIKAVDDNRSAFIGTAFPVETGPSDNLAITAAVALAKPGDVIVAASDGFERTGVIGDIVALMGRNAGIAGFVIDGMARDLAGLVEVGVPVFSRGVIPNSCVRSGPGKVGQPIVAAGVRVEAGDLIMGDRDGVVVVPKANVEAVLAKVDEIRKAEGELIARVKSEKLTRFDFMDEMLKSDQVEYLD